MKTRIYAAPVVKGLINNLEYFDYDYIILLFITSLKKYENSLVTESNSE